MSATATEPATVVTPTSPTFEEIRSAVPRLTPAEREGLREELAFQERIDSPEFRREVAEARQRVEAGQSVSLDDFIREHASSEPAGPRP